SKIEIHFARHQAAALRTILPQDARELARVDVGDADDAVALQVAGQAFLRPEIRMQRRQVPDDQSGGVAPGRFLVLRVDARVADVRIGQRHYLATVRGVG